MRYEPGHKERTRARILGAAARLLRREGVHGASVERVMRRAGLTVGGFYAHFASKTALVAETLRAFMQARREEWLLGLDGLRGWPWAEPFLRRYLNETQRDDLEAGCLLPTVLSDLTEGRAEVRHVVVEELDALVGGMSAGLGDGPGATARQRALALFVLSVGGLALSRATRRTAMSAEVLEACVAFARDAFARGEAGPAGAPQPRAPEAGSV